MATRFYLPVSGTAYSVPYSGLSPDANWELTTGLVRLPLLASGSAFSPYGGYTPLTSFTGTWGSSTTQQWVWGQWQSDELAEQYDWTTADTVSMVVGKCAETSNGGDSHLAYVVRVITTGSSVRGTVGLYHATSSEFPLVASAATRIHNARTDGATNFTSYPGDRVVVELGLHGVTPALERIQMRFGHPSGTSDFALTAGLTTDLLPWVELSKNLLFGKPPQTVNLNPALLNLDGKPTTATSPAPDININLQPAILSFNGQIATVTSEIPPTTINLQPARLSLSGESSLILKGDVSIPLGPAQLSLTGEPTTIQKGEVSVPLDPAQLSLSGKQSTISQMDLCSDSSRDFNGSSDRIDWVSPLNTKEQPLTIAAWLKIDTLKANQYIWMSHSSGTSSFGKVFNIVQSGGWYLDFVIQRASQSSFGGTPGAIPTGTWGHVAVTHDALGYSASNVTFYYNGITGTTNVVLTGSGAEGNQTGSWSVGGRIYDNTRNIDAKIGEVAVWNRVLTREEIAQLANRANPISATNIYDGLVFASHPETLENLVNHQVGIATGTVLQSGPCLTYNTVTYLNAAQLSLSGKPVQVNAPAPGIQINLQPALLSLSAKQASVQKGAVTVTLDPALLTLSGKNVTISAPAPGIQIDLQPARLSLSAQPSTVQKGAVSIALDPALLSLSGKTTTISTGGAPQTINLQPARLTLSGKSASIQKGAVSISLDPALLNLSGNHATIITPYSQTINLDPALLSLNGQIAHPDSGYIPPTPAPCIPTGGGGLLKRQDTILLLLPKEDRKRQLDEDIVIITE